MSNQTIVVQNDVQVFEGRGFKVRLTIDEAGTAWFVAKDVVETLGYLAGNMRVALQVVPAVDKQLRLVQLGFRWNQPVWGITEQGVHFLTDYLYSSNASAYDAWITNEVIPSIDWSRRSKLESVVRSTDVKSVSEWVIKEPRVKSDVLSAVQEAKQESPEELQIFNNQEFTVRAVTDADGVVWFVTKDIARGLDYKEASLNQVNNLFAMVPDIWSAHKRIMVRDKNGSILEREVLCLTEQGVYFFLGRSDKPKALPYQMWITGEVVPSIRATGGYNNSKKSRRTSVQKLQEAYQRLQDDYTALQQQYDRMQGEYIKALPVLNEWTSAPVEELLNNPIQLLDNGEPIDHISIEDLANLLSECGARDIGRNDLFMWMRLRGWLSADEATKNQPTAQAQSLNLFTTQQFYVTDPKTHQKTLYTQTRVTAEGVQFFLNLLVRGETFNSHHIQAIVMQRG